VRVRFWGTRGSIATPGPGTNYFGGNTSCVELITANGNLLIFDCGTGAHRLAAELMAQGRNAINTNILLGHTHWDHIQGFPFFSPAFVHGNSIFCAYEGCDLVLEPRSTLRPFVPVDPFQASVA